MSHGEEKSLIAAMEAAGMKLANHPPSAGPDPYDVPPVCIPGVVEWYMDTASPYNLTGEPRWQTRNKCHSEYGVTPLSTLSLYHAIMLFSSPGILEYTGHIRRSKKGYTHVRWPVGKPDRVHLSINYPCRNVDLVIHPATLQYIEQPPETTFGGAYLAWVVAQAYLRIYAEHERFEVWGHAMSDLVIEDIQLEQWKVGQTDIRARVLMGS